MELLLLETFDWNLCMPTAAHFIDYYLHASVKEDDLYNGWPISSISKTKVFMDKYTHYFLEVSLQGGLRAVTLFQRGWHQAKVLRIYVLTFVCLLMGSCRPRLLEFSTISGCLRVCGCISNLPSDFTELDDCPASAHGLLLGPPHPVHRAHAAVRETHSNHCIHSGTENKI